MSDDIIVDEFGRPVPILGDTKKEIARMLHDGNILAVILQSKTTGAVSVQVYGPPTREMLDILETTVRGFARVLKGHA